MKEMVKLLWKELWNSAVCLGGTIATMALLKPEEGEYRLSRDENREIGGDETPRNVPVCRNYMAILLIVMLRIELDIKLNMRLSLFYQF